MTIANNLLQVYNLTSQKLKKITLKDNSSRLELTNPMTINDYFDALEAYPSKDNQFERWQYVREKAEDEVKISFFFMAGILDILEGLENSFNNIK